MSFIKELKRRNVIRAVLTYAVAGWLLVEVMDLLTGAFDAPAWVLKVFIGAISPGILPVFIISWVYEITPEGNTEETERLVQHWLREATADPAELTSQRQTACTVLGMSGATNAAVECIRIALVEPSYAMPFLEPFLPYYDPIREEPAFVELLAELEDAY